MREDDLDELSDANLRQLIHDRAPWFDGSIEPIEWRAVVRFEQRLVTRFGVGRTWLAGDAAHMAAPGGVQSMNVGLREGMELADILAGVVRGESSKRLNAFGIARLREWRALHGLGGYSDRAMDASIGVGGTLGHLVAAIPASGKDLDLLLDQIVARTHAV